MKELKKKHSKSNAQKIELRKAKILSQLQKLQSIPINSEPTSRNLRHLATMVSEVNRGGDNPSNEA